MFQLIASFMSHLKHEEEEEEEGEEEERPAAEATKNNFTFSHDNDDGFVGRRVAGKMNGIANVCVTGGHKIYLKYVERHLHTNAT